jgi:3-(3-hydroxy-phenyl)propionate hydroxylase
MATSFTHPTYAYRRPPELDGAVRHCATIVVGAGPVGLTVAIDLAQRGLPVLVLDDDDTVSVGSRAICYSKRTLEILDRLGCGEPIAQKGVGWKVGKVYQGSDLAYQFDLQPETGHHRPAFVNLQQYYSRRAWSSEHRRSRRSRCAGATRSWPSRLATIA